MADELVVSRSRPGAFPTVAAALAAAGSSVTVRVEPGVYAGSLSVRDRTVVVRAVGGPGTVTLEARDGAPVLTAERSHVVLEDVALHGAGTGTARTVEVAGGVVELTGCAVTWRAGHGVIVTDGARAAVTRCRFDGPGHGVGFVASGGRVEHCDFTGPDLCGVSARHDSSPEVRHCAFHDVRYGFMAFEGAAGTVEDCVFTDVRDVAIGAGRGAVPAVRRCRVVGGSGTGIFVGDGSGGTFEDCEVTGLGGRGIALATAGAPVVRGCRVERPGKEGLYLEGGRVEDIVVERATGTAVLVRGGTSELVGVSVTGGEIGIAVTGDDPTSVRLVGGSVRATTGLFVAGAAVVTAAKTTVTGDGDAVAVAEDARLTLTGCALGGAGHGVVCDSAGGAVLADCDLSGVAGTPVAGSRVDAVRISP